MLTAASTPDNSASGDGSGGGGGRIGSIRRKLSMQKSQPQQQQQADVPVTAEHPAEALPTNAFGEIEFSGMKQLAKFVRLDSNTPDSAIYELLVKKWEMSRPTLVINIFGGDFEKKRQLKMIFKKGLWKAAESAGRDRSNSQGGCWIVTSGFNLGIMKLAGEAVRDYTDAYGGNHMNAIGIASWGCIARREALENHNYEGSFPASYQSEDSGGRTQDSHRAAAGGADEEEWPLDPNHTHFFLVDTGVSRLKGRDCQFRTRFAHVIGSWRDEENREVKVPMCGLLIGGDRFSLEQIYYALTVNHCPIMAMKGTGGAADVVAAAFDSYFQDDSSAETSKKELETEEAKQVRLSSKLRGICQEFFNPAEGSFDYTKEVEMLHAIMMQHTSLIEVFDMEEDFDLDGKMIASLLSSAGSDTGQDQLNLKQLKICLTLNRADIARDKIFLENKKWKKGNLNDFMYQALMEDRHDFVKLFLEQGFSLEDFLTVYILEKLYTDQLKRLNSKVAIFLQLWEYYRSHRSSKQVKLREVGKVIKVLVGDFYQPLYTKKDFEGNLANPTTGSKQRSGSSASGSHRKDKSSIEAGFHQHQQQQKFSQLMRQQQRQQQSGTELQILEAGGQICDYERSPVNFSGRGHARKRDLAIANNISSESNVTAFTGILFMDEEDESFSDAGGLGFANPMLDDGGFDSPSSPADGSGDAATAGSGNIKRVKRGNRKVVVASGNLRPTLRRRRSSLEMLQELEVLHRKLKPEPARLLSQHAGQPTPAAAAAAAAPGPQAEGKGFRLRRRRSSLEFMEAMQLPPGSQSELRQQQQQQQHTMIGPAPTGTKVLTEEETKAKSINLERPARELLIWSLLVGKLQMAELFWTMEKEPVAAALLSSMILKAMVGRTDDFTDKEDFQRGAALFEDHAWGVLDQCYREDERRALLLINRELRFYGDSSCIYLAAEGESIKFMAHPCCQDFLTSTWMGRLSAKNSMTRFSIGVLCGLVCPLLVPSVMLYKLTDREIERQAVEQQQQQKSAAATNTGSSSVAMATVDPESGGQNFMEMEKRKSLISQLRRVSKLNCGQVFERVREFYMAPVVRFVYNTFAYMTFLFLFSYLLLFELKHNITVMEYIVIVWIGTLLLEEVKQATLSGISFSTYISDSWNKLDCTAVGLFVLGFILRMISLLSESPAAMDLATHSYDVILTDGLFIIARICYAFSLFSFYIRLMYIFSFHIALGPKLIMIGKMVINDLVPFMVILLVFILGYGVAAQSIAYPTGFYTPSPEFNKTSPDKMTQTEIFIHFLTRAYFQMFGDFGLDSIQAEDKDCLDEGKCPHWTAKWLLPIMLGVYVLLTNILMFNLLIAMFSSTYESINQFSALHWNYQRYSMIKEYIERSPLAPPLIIIWHVYELAFYIQLRYQGRKRSELEDPLRISYKDNVKKERELIKWEHMKAMDFLRQGQESHSKKGGRSDSRSVIVRTSGPQPGLLPTAAADVAKQMSDATSGIGLELEKKFKNVDSQLTKISADFDARLSELTNTLATFTVTVQALREGQDRLATVQQARSFAGAVGSAEAQQQQLAQLEQRVLDAVRQAYQAAPPAWFQELSRAAAIEALASTPVSVRDLDSGALQQLTEAASSTVGSGHRRWRRRVVPSGLTSEAAAALGAGSAAGATAGLERATTASGSQSGPFVASPGGGSGGAGGGSGAGVGGAAAGESSQQSEEDDEEDDNRDYEEEDAATIRPLVDDPAIGRLVQYLSLQHRLWRYVPFNFEQYPGMRMNVPPEKIAWEVEYKDYFAYDASEEVLIYPNEESYDGPTEPLQSIRFNQLDLNSGMQRQSMLGKYRLDPLGAPLNPTGRTGLKCKGLLPRWGPNNAVVIAMTRWSRAPSGAIIHRLGHPILQVLALFRHKQFCLPWFLTDHFDQCDYDDCVPALLKNFISRRLKQLLQRRDARQEINAIVKGRAEQAIRNATSETIFKGYLDDHLNADNAWIEAVVINIHESDNWKFSDAMLKVFSEPDSDEQARWMEVAYSTAMRSSHCEMLKTIASNHRAYF